MKPVNCPRCGAHLLLCDAAATPRAPKPWAAETPIHHLPVSARAKHIVNDGEWDSDAKAWVRTNRFRTAGDVDEASDSELLRIPNFGRVSLKELREAIKTLKEQRHEPPPPDADEAQMVARVALREEPIDEDWDTKMPRVEWPPHDQ